MYSYYPYSYIPQNILPCPYLQLVKLNSKLEESNNQYRGRKKKKDNIYIPEIIDLVTCFNPAILNSKEFNCIARLNARKIVKNMLNSILDCNTEKCKQQKQQLWYYYSLFYQC